MALRGGLLAALAVQRLRSTGRRLKTQVALYAALALALFFAVLFLLGAILAALAAHLGPVGAFLVMMAVALVAALIIGAMIGLDRRARRREAARSEAVPGMAQAALIGILPSLLRAPPRRLAGFGLVALGAMLVMMRRRDDD